MMTNLINKMSIRQHKLHTYVTMLLILVVAADHALELAINNGGGKEFCL